MSSRIDRRWRKVARDLWLHRGRSAMVILAIVVGLTGAGAVLDTWALLRRVTREEYLATNPASATLRLAPGDSVDDALLVAVRALPAVRDAESRRTTVASVQVGDAWHSAVLFSSGDPAGQRIGRLVPVQGAWPPVDGGFVIEHSSVEYSGAAVGDSVVVRVGDGEPVRLPIAGVARDAGLAPGWMEHVVYAFVAPATLVRLGVPAAPDQLLLTVRDDAADRMSRGAVRAVALQAVVAARRLGHSVRALDVPEPGRHIHAAQMDSLLMTKGAFGLLALLLSGFLVVNLVTAMLAGQLREIGVMKAIGAEPAQLARMYLGLALALGLVASAIAIPLAALAGRAYARFAASLLNFSVEEYAIPRWAIAVQLAAGALLPVLAAVAPVVKGSRVSVAAALRDTGLSGADAAPRWIERVRGPRRPLLLSLRNAFRRRLRMALTLVTLSLGGATFLAALDLRAAIRASVSHLYGELLRFDMTARFDTPQVAEAALRVARAVPGVETAEAWSGARAALAGADALGEAFAVTAVPADSRLLALTVVAGRWLAPDDTGALVVNDRLLEEQPALALGREVSLLVRGRASSWRIVGVVKSGPAAQAWVARGAFAHATGDTLASTVVVRAASRELGAQSDLVLRLREAVEGAGIPVASTQLTAANRRVIEDHLLMVASFLLAMAQLAVIVGGLGLASTMSLAVLERTREIGVLRAIGATPGAVMRLVQLEGLVIALLSWAAAVPLSIPVSVALGAMFGRIMFPVPVRLVPEWGAMAVWLAVVIVVSVVACAWPARRATRVVARVALAYE